VVVLAGGVTKTGMNNGMILLLLTRQRRLLRIACELWHGETVMMRGSSQQNDGIIPNQ
jgi:hypothetical protein